jgi:hypothetical protein
MRIHRAITIGLTSIGLLAGSLALSDTAALGFIGHEYLSQITEAPPGSPVQRPTDLAFDGNGDVFFADEFGGGQALDEFNSSNVFQAQVIGPINIRGVAVSTVSGDIYLEHNIVSADHLSVMKPNGKGGYENLSSWTGANSKLGSFSEYLYPAVDDSTSPSDPHAGDVYVLSTEQNVVDIFKPKPAGPEEALDGEFVGELTVPGGFSFLFADGLTVDAATGEVYVADTNHKVIDEFSSSGSFLGSISGSQVPGGEFLLPTSVAVEESTGDVYVNDAFGGAVYQFSSSGELVGSMSETPSAPFTKPLAVAVKKNGNVYVAEEGVIDVFGPSILVPDVTTGSSEVVKGSVTLEGTVNPDGQEVTSCEFEYGTSTKYGHVGPCSPAPGSGSSSVAVSAKLTGLDSPTEYHYRIVAANANGSHYGVDKTFTTPATLEMALESASEVEGTSARLNGVFLTGGLSTHTWFEYGTTPEYGTSTPHEGTGNEEVEFAAAHVVGLVPNTTYHFHFMAENEFGPTHSEDGKFTTKAIPATVGQPLPVSAITRSTAVVSGSLNPEKSATTYHIIFGQTTNYGENTVELEAGSGLGEVEFHVGLEGLVPGKLYHYALVAINQAGTVIGPDETFTVAAPTPPTAVTGGASNVTLTTATVSGTIDAEGLETSYELDFGTDTTYGTSIYGEAGASAEPIELSVPLKNLAPGATYHYRIVAINSDGKVYGADQTFTTPAYSAPIVLPSALPLIQAPSIAFPTETGSVPVTTKALTNAQKLASALKACKKKAKRLRAGCEKRARKRYVVAKAKKKTKK